jgi:uncharacterized protein YabE (DUF348 family)/3D (Asp-Asp-Asp) domain-containing protein
MGVSISRQLVILLLILAALTSLVTAVLFFFRQAAFTNPIAVEPTAVVADQAQPSLTAAEGQASLRPSSFSATKSAQPAAVSSLPKDVTIHDGEQEQALRTTAATVGEALQAAGVTLEAADHISPPLDTPLAGGLTIQVRRAMPVTIAVDGRQLETMTLEAEPHAALAAAGIGLVGFDYIRPASEQLQPGDTIEVVRVSEAFIIEEEPIPFETVYQADGAMELDTQAVVSTGTPGLLRRRIRVRSENGQEAGREVESEWVARVAVNQVIAYGTAVNIRMLETPEGPVEYWRVVRMHVVSYTPSSAGKSPGEPGYGVTASGLPAGKGVAAVDPRVVPFRSRIYVPGYGIAVAGDTGGGVKGRLIDLGYADDEYVHWSRSEDVYFLTPVPENITYILP